MTDLFRALLFAVALLFAPFALANPAPRVWELARRPEEGVEFESPLRDDLVICCDAHR